MLKIRRAKINHEKRHTAAKTMENFPTNHPQPKLPKLKAFKAIQKNFGILGISPELATQSHPFNRQILFGLSILGTAIIFLCVFIFNYAENLFEYTQSIFFVLIAALIFFVLLILIIKVKSLFELINRCEEMLNTSK